MTESLRCLLKSKDVQKPEKNTTSFTNCGTVSEKCILKQNCKDYVYLGVWRNVCVQGKGQQSISARAQEHFNKAVPFTDAGYSQPARTCKAEAIYEHDAEMPL